MELQDKIALVTGASRGIGAQIIEGLARRGAHLFVTWSGASERSKQSAAEAVERIKQLGLNTKVHSIAIDLSKPEAPSQIVEEFLKHYDHADIVVNNAGIAPLKSFKDTTIEDYNSIMDLNLRAAFFLVQAIQPHLRAPSRIINISSIAARLGFPLSPVYCMSKSGLEGMTRSMAREFGADGTTVNAVAPGVVITDILETWEKEWVEGDAASTPVERRNGKPDDISQVVAWLAGESSRWVTGQTISASGGSMII